MRQVHPLPRRHRADAPRPAGFMGVNEGKAVRTHTDRPRESRRRIVEMRLAEGNHIGAVGVADGNREPQDAAMAVGRDHERLDSQAPRREADISHERSGIDHDRCIAPAEAHYGRSPRARLITIPAADLSIGEDLSTTAMRGVDRAVRLISEMVE